MTMGLLTDSKFQIIVGGEVLLLVANSPQYLGGRVVSGEVVSGGGGIWGGSIWGGGI